MVEEWGQGIDTCKYTHDYKFILGFKIHGSGGRLLNRLPI